MGKIVDNILNSCNPIKGLQSKMWIFNRTDFTATTSDNVLSGLAKIGSVVGYTCTGTKDYANAGHEAKVQEMLCTGFAHKLTLNLTVGTAAQQKNIDQADDLLVVVKSNSGQLFAYGVKNGLWKVSQSAMANDNKGLIAVEYGTREGMEEDYSVYYCTLSEAQLNALLV